MNTQRVYLLIMVVLLLLAGCSQQQPATQPTTPPDDSAAQTEDPQNGTTPTDADEATDEEASGTEEEAAPPTDADEPGDADGSAEEEATTDEETADEPDDTSGPDRRLAQVPIGNLDPYEHPTGVFRIDYPQRWSIEENSSSEELVTQFYSPERNGLVSVVVIEVPEADALTEDELGAALGDVVTEVFGDMANLSLDEPVVQEDGSVLVVFTVEETVEDVTTTLLANSFIQTDGNYLSILMFALPEDQFEERRDKLDEILNSYAVDPTASIASAEDTEATTDMAEEALPAPEEVMPEDEPLGDEPLASDADGMELTTYSGPAGIFMLDVPETWDIQDESAADQVQVTFTAPDGSGVIVVAITDLGAASAVFTPEDIGNLLVEGIEGAFGSQEDFTIGEPEEQPDGSLGVQFSFNGPGPIGTMEGLSFAQFDESYFSSFWVIFSEEVVAEHPAMIDTIINSYVVDPSVPLPQ